MATVQKIIGTLKAAGMPYAHTYKNRRGWVYVESGYTVSKVTRSIVLVQWQPAKEQYDSKEYMARVAAAAAILQAAGYATLDRRNNGMLQVQ